MRHFLVGFLALIGFSILCPAQSTVVDSILIDTTWRNYRLYKPTGYSPQDKPPLVINMHGLGANAVQQQVYSLFDFVADTAGAMVCYPNGLNNSWNILGGAPDDVHFIDTLIAHLHAEYNINLDRVYATGMSNGGFMTHLLACQLTHRFAAIADVTGSNTTPNQAACAPSKKIPVLHVHGTADGIVPYNGSFGVVSVDNLMTYWAIHNGCDLMTDTVAIPNINSNDQCTAERITWRNCDSNTQVILYRVINGEHTWPGSPIIIGVTNQDFNASEVIWQFFDQFPDRSTGIHDGSPLTGIRMYPNPAKDIIHISGEATPVAVTLFDLSGKVVRSIDICDLPLQLPVGSIASGLYVMEVTGDGKSLRETIVIQ